MIGKIDVQIDVASEEEMTAARDLIGTALAGEGVTVISQSAARVTQRFRVVGIHTDTKQPFDETIEAINADAAKILVETATKRVADVRYNG